jgi:NAD(P)-dependent dehydrogenase (short-subunit alcohol dehydrogenase family)
MAIYLITGADRGIGQALCLALCERGENVIATCLEDSPLLAQRGAHVERGIDVTSDEAVQSLAKRLVGTRLDVLVSNAGIAGNGTLGNLDLDDMRSQFEVNALGPLRVIDALLPCLRQGSKIGIITSRVGSLAHDVKGRGVAVVLLHPGMVRTVLKKDVQGDLVEPAVSARGLLARTDDLTLETTGTFWRANGEQLPW